MCLPTPARARPCRGRPIQPSQRGEHEEGEGEPEQLEERAPLARAALLLERLEGDLLEHRALPVGQDRVGHRDSVLLRRQCRSGGSPGRPAPGLASGSSEAPRHGPATHIPVPGSKIAPCVEQTKYSPALLEELPRLPVELGARVRAAVHDRRAPRRSSAPRSPFRRAVAAGEVETHARPALGERRRGADQPCVVSHRCSSATLAQRARAGRVASSSSSCAP